MDKLLNIRTSPSNNFFSSLRATPNRDLVTRSPLTSPLQSSSPSDLSTGLLLLIWLNSNNTSTESKKELRSLAYRISTELPETPRSNDLTQKIKEECGKTPMDVRKIHKLAEEALMPKIGPLESPISKARKSNATH